MDYGLYNTLPNYVFSMAHGPYIVTISHDPWAIQRCTIELGYMFPMPHGLYNGTSDPCSMGCTAAYPAHGPWVVQHSYPPCPMDCTTLCPPCPMGCTMILAPMPHGLYKGYTQIEFPCPMGCTTLLVPMTHELYNNHTTHDPWAVQHFCHP